MSEKGIINYRFSTCLAKPLRREKQKTSWRRTTNSATVTANLRASEKKKRQPSIESSFLSLKI